MLTFQAANRANNGVEQENFEVLIDGSVVGTFAPSSTSYQSYSTAAFPVIAGTTPTITFQGLDSAGGDNTAFIDQVAVATASSSSIGDPGFEQPMVGAGNFQYDPTTGPPATWVFTGSSGISGNNSGFTSGNPNAPQGAQVAILQQTGSFSQSVTGLTAGSYVLTFEAAQRGNNGVSQENFNVLIDGQVVGTSFTPSSTSYQSYSTAAFSVAGAGAHTIKFQGLDSAGGDNTAFIDSVTLAAAAAPIFISPAAGSFNIGSANTFTVTTTGTPTATLSEAGPLPSGVTFVSNGNGTATLSGTPAAGTGGTYNLSITAANGVGSPVTQPFTLTVAAAQTVAITSVANTSFVTGTQAASR